MMKEIKNCWERLKPFIKENLEKDKDRFPHLYQDAKTELEANVSIQQLRYGTLSTLTTFTNGKYGFKLNDYYDMFED